ncbi:MAG: DMT family transporter [Myxococcota bacterium]
MPPSLAVVVGVIAISFAAIFFRETEPMHPLIAAGLRLSIAAVALSPFVVRGFARLPAKVRRDAVLGGLLYALHFGTWVTSLTLTTVAASVTLVTATPLLLASVAFLSGRDRPSRMQLAAIAIALVGVVLIGYRDLGEGALLGDALAFAGAAAMAGYLLVVRRHGAIDVWAFTGIACAVGGATLLATAFALGVPIEIPSLRSGVFVVLAALIPQLIGHSALTWSLRHLRPTTIGLATVAEPVGSTLLAWVWLREVPAELTLVGCGVTLSAVLLSFRGESTA